MNQLQCAADEVLYVGDSEVDIETSRNAGVPIVAVSWGFRDVNFLKTLHPDFLIHHPSELLDILNLSNKSLW
jgi:phosphoglycolate phosphatase